MGAGRKTQALTLKEKSHTPWTINCSATSRNLRKGDLGGVIFGCKHNTMKECYSEELFGLPAPHFSYVRNINPGLPLFLFNYSDRRLYGIFEAASRGGLNINPYAWTADGLDYTPYAAQVRTRMRMQCQPLLEDQFGPIIAENYYEPKLFWFELDQKQTNKLISLFSNLPDPMSNKLVNSDKWTHLSTPNGREGDNHVEGPMSDTKMNPDKANTEWGRSRDAFDFGGENRPSDPLAHNRIAKVDNQEAGKMNLPNGRTYSSVLRSIGTSAVCAESCNTECHSWTIPGLGREQQLLEASNYEKAAEGCYEKSGIDCSHSFFVSNTSNIPLKESRMLETTKNAEAINHDHGVMDLNKKSVLSYSPIVTSTSSSQKEWSSMFKDFSTSNLRNREENFKTRASALNIHNRDQSNDEWESSYIAPCSNEERKLLEAHRDAPGNDNEQVMIFNPSTRVFCSSVAADTIDEGEYKETEALEVNSSYSVNSNMQASSYAAFPSIDASQPSDATMDEDTSEIRDGLSPSNSNCERPSFLVATEELILEDDPREDTQIEWISNQNCFSEVASVLDLKPCSLQSFVAQLLQEVKEMKSSQLKQVERISFLEQDLVASRREMQELKDRYKMLECETYPNKGQVEEKEFEPTIESDQNFDESILVVGGFDGVSWLSAFNCYHPSQDLMESLTPMSSVRSYASTVKLNNEVYVCGGMSGNSWNDAVESYNIATGQWASRPSLNHGKGSLAGLPLDHKIFALGGGNGHECFSDVEMLDLDIGRWIPSRSMIHKRFALAAAEINGILYAVGGFDGEAYLKSVERFDPRECSWRRVQSMSTRRGCHSLVALNEKLYAVGGFDGDQMIPTIEVYDPRGDSWMMSESMSDPRGYCGAVVLGDAIYVIGGVKENNELLDKVECYKEGRGWELTNLKAVGKRCFFSTIVL